MSPPEREALQKLCALGLVDIVQKLYPSTAMYTWWDYRALGFPRDKGLRIDHFLLTPELADKARSASVDREARKGEKTSDHAPVLVELELLAALGRPHRDPRAGAGDGASFWYRSAVSAPPLPLGTRLWYAFAVGWRVLLDPLFAGRVFELGQNRAAAELPPGRGPAAARPPVASERPPPERDAPREPARAHAAPALQLLSLFQREGRFIDFIEEDIAAFKDAEVGAAARVVHDGCRKALREHASLEPVRAEAEGASVTLPLGFDAAEVKLTGDVRGAGPFRGTLRHRGWRARELRLPALLDGADPHVLTPAEVEL